jgi:hypothetical protein
VLAGSFFFLKRGQKLCPISIKSCACRIIDLPIWWAIDPSSLLAPNSVVIRACKWEPCLVQQWSVLLPKGG